MSVCEGLFWHPTLEIFIENEPPDCHLTTLVHEKTGAQAACYYFRLQIKNSGNASAEVVEVSVEKVLYQRADEVFEEWQGFLPLNLLWAHYGKAYSPTIPPGLYKHLRLRP